ncbi:MAG: carbohydrate binding domain-containing protein, partial [Hyphomicrobium sp.]
MQVFPYNRVPDGSTVLATNLFTNPNLVGDGTWAEVRRNLVTNPSFEVDTAGWTPSVGGIMTRTTLQWHVGAASLQIAATASAQSAVIGNITVSPSITYTASAWMKGEVGKNFIVSLVERTSAGAYVGETASSSVTTTGDWQRIVASRTLSGTGGRVEVVVRNSFAGAHTYYVDAVQLEVGSTATPYFDGSSPQGSIDHDMRQRWLGTANASESVMEIERVAGLTATNCIAGVSSEAGKPAVRQIPTTTSNNSFFELPIPAAARALGTLIGDLHVGEALTGSLNAIALRLRTIAPDMTDGPTPNLPGTYPLRHEFSVTSTNRALFMHGGSLGSGDVWWTDIGLFAGVYEGPAFSGDTPDDGDIFHEWSGVANSSTSKRSLRNFLPVASDMTPHTIVEVDGLAVGVAFITLWRDDGARWSEVRGAVMAPVAGSWAGVDWECGFNRVTAYRVEQFDSAGLSLGFLPAVTVTLTSQETWVQNVMAPKGG